MKRPLIALSLCSFLVACSSIDKAKREIGGPTISEIPDLTSETVAESSLNEEVSLEQVEQYYQSALNVATDAGTRRTILKRLVDILMIRSENEMLSSGQNGQYFNEAITRYRELIQLQQQTIAAGGDAEIHRKQIDEMLYQLSKAYALDGQTDEANKSLEALTANYSDSSYSPEAKFRRAETAFSNGQYELAETLYAEVIGQGTFTPFYQNAIYMYGWSQFKQSKYDEATPSFMRVLDHLYGAMPPLREVPASQQSLADDTLRVVSLSFSYENGPESLSKYMADKNRPYTHLVYKALGELYFEKERFRDSANAYRQYVLDYPLADMAPLFSGYVIDVYERGNFPSLLIPAKAEYISNYGIDSQFWAMKTPAVHELLKPNLKTYLDELAKYEHANAQRLVSQKLTPEGAKNAAQLQESARQSYLKAANWYDQFVRTFPEDVQSIDMQFLKAESLKEGGEIEAAFTAYRRLAYEFKLTPEKQKTGADAGYSVIVMAQRLLAQSTTAEQQARWDNEIINQSLAYADRYATDARAAGVLTAGAEKLLQAGRQPEAILAAKRVTAWQPPASSDLQRTAWLVIGQAEFDLANYSGADEAYGQALLLTALTDPIRQSIVDRQAASVYKFAEGLIAQDDKQAAVTQLLRIQDISPDSSIAQTAQYDAGNQLMELQRWQQAEAIFLNFRRRYPTHTLINSLYAKLVVIYQETEQWELAGNELTAMAAVSDDPELRRQSLALAAELYEKSGQTAKAMTTYQQYIQRYPIPVDDNVESIFKLAKLYQLQKNTAQYNYWLQQLIVTHNKAGQQATARSLFLAAFAANHQAAQKYQRFESVRLSLPLKNSLQKKQAALSEAVSAYQTVINYGVADFVTEANYYLAQAYITLSQELIDSDRPSGLDALALEQYEILLEEQVYPIEERGIELHESNIARAKDNLYDQWVKRSYASLASLVPGRYQKPEEKGVVRELY